MIADLVVQKQGGNGQGRGKDQEMEGGKPLHIRNSVCGHTLPQSFQNVTLYTPRSPGNFLTAQQKIQIPGFGVIRPEFESRVPDSLKYVT